ncbi:hypothetical protein ACHAXT_001676 [Thalassiosira profunda]
MNWRAGPRALRAVPGGRGAPQRAMHRVVSSRKRATSCRPSVGAPPSPSVRVCSSNRPGWRTDAHQNALARQAPSSLPPSICNRRQFSSLQPPRLAHEWVVGGKVVPSAQMDERAVSQDNEVIVFLHGLLGNAKNLRTPAKKLTQQLPHVTALLLDIRGHGNSSSVQSQFAQPHNFHTCVEDVVHTLSDLGLTGTNSPSAICGHSLGGRIALQYSHSLQSTQQQLMGGEVLEPPKQTWVLDSVPGRADPSVHHVLTTISSLPTPIPSKGWLIDTLVKEHRMSKGVAMWIASNLKDRGDKSFEWVFDLSIANELVANFNTQNLTELIHDVTTAGDDTDHHASTVQLVMAGQNKLWSEEIVEELRSIPSFQRTPPSFHMHRLDKAGHWVHVDDLEGLLKLMVTGLR